MVEPTKPSAAHGTFSWREADKWNIRFSVFWAAFFTILAAIVTLSQVAEEYSSIFNAPQVGIDLALPLFVVLTGVLLVALSLRIWDSVWGVLGLAGLGIAAVAPTLLAVLAPRLGLPMWFFLGTLLFWVVLAVLWVSPAGENAWASVLLGLAMASTVIALICEIGLRSPIRFAEIPLAEVRSLSILLDLRITLSILFGSLALLTAVVRAFLRKFPKVPHLPTPQLDRIEDDHPILAPLINPPIIVVNATLFIGVAFVNMFVGILVAIVLLLLFAGAELGQLLWELLTHRNAMLRLGKCLLAILATFGLLIGALELNESLRQYLRASNSYALEAVAPVLVLCCWVVVCTALVTLVVDGRQVIVPRALFGASLLAIMLLLAGGLTYAVVGFDVFPSSGFRQLGPITAGGSALIMCGLLAVTVTNVSKWRQRGDLR